MLIASRLDRFHFLGKDIMATRPPVSPAQPPIRGLGREFLGAFLVLASVVGAAWIGSTLIGWRSWALLGCLVVMAVGTGLLLRLLGEDGSSSGNGAETGRLTVVDPDDPDAMLPRR
jgi:hypothetical protein